MINRVENLRAVNEYAMYLSVSLQKQGKVMKDVCLLRQQLCSQSAYMHTDLLTV